MSPVAWLPVSPLMEHITYGTANHNMEDREVGVCVWVFVSAVRYPLKRLAKAYHQSRISAHKPASSIKKEQ